MSDRLALLRWHSRIWPLRCIKCGHRQWARNWCNLCAWRVR